MRLATDGVTIVVTVVEKGFVDTSESVVLTVVLALTSADTLELVLALKLCVVEVENESNGDGELNDDIDDEDEDEIEADEDGEKVVLGVAVELGHTAVPALQGKLHATHVAIEEAPEVLLAVSAGQATQELMYA